MNACMFACVQILDLSLLKYQERDLLVECFQKYRSQVRPTTPFCTRS
jgi:hypothetical protein